MKKFLFFIIFLSVFVDFKTQGLDPFPKNCIENIMGNIQNVDPLNNPNCGNTSDYYKPNEHSNPLYVPQNNDDLIYIKLNFIFLTKPDGTGNFEQNNPEHIEFINNLIIAFNSRLSTMDPPINGCEAYPQPTTDTKLRVIVNKIWKVDPAWNFLYTGYSPTQGPLGGTQPLYPPSSNYYYTYLDNDPTIPQGINITFANNGEIYDQYQANNYDNVPKPSDWAAAEFPSYSPLEKKLRQFWPDIYNGFRYRKHFIVGNPTWGSPTWETVKAWYWGDMGYRSMVHELGHNFGLGHHDCGANIMSYSEGSHNYLSMQDISIIYQSASISSARQYLTENSFKNTSLNVNTNELWDMNFRNYSNVNIDNYSSLKTTCKLIMAADSRVIVRNGSNFIIEGADINSANNTSWNGIKVEGNGYCLILPDTTIDNGYFYAYSDNSILPNNKSSNIKEGKGILNSSEESNSFDLFRIYPNPTGDYINIQTNEKISSVSIYNMSGQKIIYTEKNIKKIDVQNITNGIYFIEIKTNDKILSTKFIKK